MLRLPMHPRFGRMLVEAGMRGCVPEASQCAALVSGRDLLVRIGRDEGHLQDRREAFEDGGTSDFHTLLRAHQFARDHGFSVDACRRNAIHGQTARQVEDTYRQILHLAGREGLASGKDPATAGVPPTEALERCLVAGFIDQLCVRKDSGTLDCELTEGRTGTLVRESVVQKAKLLVAASVREVSGRGGRLTLLSQCTAVKLEWLREMFPQHFSSRLEHLYDRTHKRVAAIDVIRFLDLVVDQQHRREVDPVASGQCLADAVSRGWLELPNLDHGVQQWIGRVECLRVVVPELELPSLRTDGMRQALATAFHGLTLGREAQSVPLLPAFRGVLSKDQQAFVEELAPLQLPAPEGKPWKLTYATDRDEPDAPPVPEVQARLQDCLSLQEHPRIAEGRVPIRIWLQDPSGKRLTSTRDWPAWRKTEYPKLRPTLKSKHPGFLWP
jgi:ATP-dependent helicase HrpB